MAQLTVRNIDDSIAAALKARATASGRSAEAEHRRILEEALGRPGGIDFFDRARTRRVKLGAAGPVTTDLIRADRDRTE
ncbi:FitA-like ribbon-helix-helix domain-containing protein [Palleronia sp. LCG004]|uniref:FitA-like ribbon-helix-helix domain-containing protein n=1 Tax=Palleronia sp. LCG004 TaxID=3079304 RepID=UPI0029433B3F|nr:hypothetical protein [Palleronia sp. LCG004]WOI57731.1 hypothetical protein RVY76_15905 [Palleronia sp. LCG004]